MRAIVPGALLWAVIVFDLAGGTAVMDSYFRGGITWDTQHTRREDGFQSDVMVVEMHPNPNSLLRPSIVLPVALVVWIAGVVYLWVRQPR